MWNNGESDFEMHFVLQGGKWLSYHIDDLHLERDQMPSLDQLKTTSVSELFEGALRNAGLEQREDRMDVDDDAEDSSVIMGTNDARGEQMDWNSMFSKDGTGGEREASPPKDEDSASTNLSLISDGNPAAGAEVISTIPTLSAVRLPPTSSEDMDVVSQKLSEDDVPVCSEVKMLRETFGSRVQEVQACEAKVIARGPRTPTEAVHDTMRRQVI